MLSHKLKETYLSMSARLHESQDSSQKEVAKVLNDRSNLMKKYEAVKQENETMSSKFRYKSDYFLVNLRIINIKTIVTFQWKTI